MNKAELIEALSERLGDKKTAAGAVEAFVDTITRAVAKGEKVAITGFGVFEKHTRPARMVRNPATGATIKKGKSHRPRFRPGAGFKEAVSGERKLAAPAKATGAKKTAAKSTAKKTTAKKAASASTGTGRSAAKKTSTTGRKTTTKRAPAAKKTTARGTAKTASTRGAAKKTAAKSTAKRTARKRS